MSFEPGPRQRLKKPRRSRVRKPHNATCSPPYLSLLEMVDAIANERQRVSLRGGEVMMSRRERGYRTMIEKALGGEVSEVAQLLRLMDKYPETAANVVQAIVFTGPLADL